MTKFKLTKKQAQAVLETKLQQLTSLEQEKLKKESEELKKTIEELEKILGDINEILKIIVKEVNELKRKYGDKYYCREVEVLVVVLTEESRTITPERSNVADVVAVLVATEILFSTYSGTPETLSRISEVNPSNIVENPVRGLTILPRVSSP